MAKKRPPHGRLDTGGICSPDPWTRAEAALTLGEGEDPRALAVLAAMLRETDAIVADSARHALSRFSAGALARAVQDPARARDWPSPPEHVLRAFIRALRQEHTEARLADSESVAIAACAEVLAGLARLCGGEPRMAGLVRRSLFSLFGSPAPGLRAAAGRVVGALQDPAMVAPLLALARGSAPAAEREAAVQALGEMRWMASGVLDDLEALARSEGGRMAEAYRSAVRRIQASFRDAPDELIAASAPAGTGTELEGAARPEQGGWQWRRNPR